MPPFRTLILFAHPDLRLSRVHRSMLDALQPLQAERGDALVVRDLYALYPDYLIDIEAEQALAAQADLIVWQHPVQWYSMPPLMKMWLDEVLAYGWAYGKGTQALRGKRLGLALSTGGTARSYGHDGYNRYPFEAFLPAYEQTAHLCGLRLLPPWVFHGAHKASQIEIEAAAQDYARCLRTWPDAAEWDAPEGSPAPSLLARIREIGA